MKKVITILTLTLFLASSCKWSHIPEIEDFPSIDIVERCGVVYHATNEAWDYGTEDQKLELLDSIQYVRDLSDMKDLFNRMVDVYSECTCYDYSFEKPGRVSDVRYAPMRKCMNLVGFKPTVWSRGITPKIIEIKQWAIDINVD